MFEKLISSLGIFDKQSNKVSYTSIVFISGYLSITIKLFISGITIFHQKMSDVSITDWAAGVAALSAMRITNKHINNIQSNKQKQDSD